MPPKIDEKIDVLPEGAVEPITDFELLMAKIDHDAHKSYKGIEDIALENEDEKKP